jgi:hypothetical protein
MKLGLTLLFTALLAGTALLAQQRPGLFFREDWKETPPEEPITQAHVANPDLVLNLYGPGKQGIRKSHHEKPLDDPYYVWSGDAKGNWAVSLRHKQSLVDLTGLAKITWRAEQAGFRELRIILKLENGTWLVSDASDPASRDWRLREFNISDIRWRKLDIEQMVEGDWVNNPNLSRVDEIGWTDLMTGGGSPACSRLDWIEVHGRAVARPPAGN